MARTIVSAMEEGGHYFLHAMPELDQAREIYEAAVPNRIRDFPANEREPCNIKVGKPLKPFKHKLKYDAESVFWLLLWWAIQACPAEDEEFPNHNEIHTAHWSTLTNVSSASDPRTHFVPRFPKNVLHPTYQLLERLLKQMAQQLDGYPERGKDPSRRKDEYVHETFQRLILEFLCQRHGEDFMTKEKSVDPRQPQKMVGMGGSLSGNPSKMTKPSNGSKPVDTPSSRELRPRLRKRTNSDRGANSSDEVQEGDDYKPAVNTCHAF
jgi:hypothetical protein